MNNIQTSGLEEILSEQFTIHGNPESPFFRDPEEVTTIERCDVREMIRQLNNKEKVILRISEVENRTDGDRYLVFNCGWHIYVFNEQCKGKLSRTF